MGDEQLSNEELHRLKTTRVRSILREHRIPEKEQRYVIGIMEDYYHNVKETEESCRRFNEFLNQQLSESYTKAVKLYADSVLSQYV